MDLERLFRVYLGGKAPNGIFPTLESEDRKFLVFENVRIVRLKEGGGVIMSSLSYRQQCEQYPTGLVRNKWRPKVHDVRFLTWETRGSQEELGWRRVMAPVDSANRWAEMAFMLAAEKRAQDLLLEQLTIQQRLELASKGSFRIRGAATNNLYRVCLGNGFQLCDKVSSEAIISYCLHTEYWLPDSDLALSIKLMLEDEELEKECLSNAAPFPCRYRKRIPSDQHAYELEKELF